jgi:hypothetical protein
MAELFLEGNVEKEAPVNTQRVPYSLSSGIAMG